MLKFSPDQEYSELKYFSAINKIMDNVPLLIQWYQDFVKQNFNKNTRISERDSGCVLNKILNFELII